MRATSAISCIVALLLGCAEGTAIEPASSSSSGVNWSTASNGGSGGSGTTSSSGASGGGGASSSSGGGSGNGGAGGTGGAGTGGVEVALLAAGSASVLAATFATLGGWSTTTLTGTSYDAAGVTLFGNTAVGAVHHSSNALRYTVYSGGWSTLTDVGPSITSRGAPALATDGAIALMVFLGTDYKHYFGSYASSWMPSAEPVGPTVMTQSFGPTEARIARRGSETLVVFAGNDTQLYAQSRISASWQAAVAITPSKTWLPPAVASLDSGAELLVVFVREDDNQPDDQKIFFATRSGGLWSTPQKISDSVFTNSPPTLAPMSGGRAVMAYRGQDGLGYVASYDPLQSPVWSAASAVTPQILSYPAVARGVGAADAELAYLDGPGSAYHQRLIGNGWSAPTLVGGMGLQSVAIASTP